MAEDGLDFVIEIDPDTKIIRAEGDIWRKLGQAAERLIGRELDQIVSAKDYILVNECVYAIALEGGTLDADMGLLSANGNSVPVHGKLRGFRDGPRHLFTRISCATSCENFSTDLLRTGMSAPELADVMDDLEEELRSEDYDVLTFSHFSISDQNGEKSGEAIEKAADEMAKIVSVHSQSKGRSFRTGVNSVSVVHGSEFQPKVVKDRLNQVLDEDINATSISVDMHNTELTADEKVDSVKQFLGVTSILSAQPEESEDGNLSADAFVSLIGELASLALQDDGGSEESVLRATDRSCKFVRLSFPDDIPWPQSPTDEQRSFAQSLLITRLGQAKERAAKSDAPTPIIAIEARMLPLIDFSANYEALTALVIEVIGFPKQDDPEYDTICERARQMPHLMLDGIEFTKNPAIQDVARKSDGLELVTLPYSVFSGAPTSMVTAFQKTISAQTGHPIGVQIRDIACESDANLMRGCAEAFLSGPFVVEQQSEAVV